MAKKGATAQCANFRIFLSLRFFVKPISESRRVKTAHFALLESHKLISRKI